MVPRFTGYILIAVGLAMVWAGGITTADWLLCIANGGGQGCKASKSDAVVTVQGIVTTGLGLLYQRNPEKTP